MDECPLLTLQPVLTSSDARTIQHNFQQIEEWTRQMCAYAATLEARIAALEAGP